jgi:hypothetical protein
MKHAILIFLVLGLTPKFGFAQNFTRITAAAPAAPEAPKPPSISNPSALQRAGLAPDRPAVQSLAASPSSLPATVVPARYIVSRFDDEAFKRLSDTGKPILLIFSHASDPVWLKQSAVLQSILKEPEFNNLSKFQIDIGAHTEVAQRFLVAGPGTLLILKDGFERVRSTRMLKPDVIRKMLRLSAAL